MEHMMIAGTYHMPLVILSIVIATVASYTSLDLGSRITAAQGAARNVWLASGAFAMGIGIWSMHFVAMLAFDLPMPVTYDPLLVVLSVFPAILASGLALYLISQETMRLRQVLFGSVIMGAGIAGMHYIGMGSMRMRAELTYNPVILTFSVIIAVLVSMAALVFLYRLRRANTGAASYVSKGIVALVMGVAIAGMHYSGMGAAQFMTDSHVMMHEGRALNDLLLAYAIGIATLIILCFAIIGSFVDRKFASQSRMLDYTELRYKSLFQYNPDAVFTLGMDGYFQQANPAAIELLGYEEHELSKMLFLPFVVEEDVERIYKKYELVKQGTPQNDEMAINRRNGEREELHITGVPIIVHGEILGVTFIAQNITQRKRTEEAVNYMAYHDDLTGLPNRRLFMEHLSSEIARAEIEERQVFVLFLDMDRFKNYNDSLGHVFGDDLLIAFADRLKAYVAEGTMVSRLGGDEFTLIVTNAETVEAVERTAQAILETIAQPFVIRGHELSITTSIGIASYPDDGADVETLMKNADTAMYRAKERGNRYQLYNPAMNPKAYEKIVMEIDLRKALDRNEFLVYYQPQINMETMQIQGVEALIRWKHAERGLVSPGQFIPIAEESGLIVPIGEWVLRTACEQGQAWVRAGYERLRVSVNLSLRQFQDTDLVRKVEQVLAETGMPPEYLELEITESMTMDVERAIQVLNELKELGVHVGIDDFGTGYSSLSYLKRFPIDRLKIDQSFVRDIHIDMHDAEIVTTIISMAHNLKLQVTAEGVETEEQLHFLKDYGCDEAQGYLFARPLPADEVTEMLRPSTLHR